MSLLLVVDPIRGRVVASSHLTGDDKAVVSKELEGSVSHASRQLRLDADVLGGLADGQQKPLE
jgi:hypothetical protein